jgi:hypothetical protein
MLVAPSSPLSWLRLVSVLLAGLAGRTLAEDERIIGGTVVAGSERSSFSLIIILQCYSHWTIPWTKEI